MDVEETVKSFYDGDGWKSNDLGHTVDAQLFEDLRPCAAEYVSACRDRVRSFLPRSGEIILDAASGPIQYPEYIGYSAGFKKRVCVDISRSALTQAKKKLGPHGETVCASILNLPFPRDHFDAVISLHTIYHIDRENQDAAVRQLLRVVKPSAPLVIVYSNPDRLLARLKRAFSRGISVSIDDKLLYFFCYPLRWWKRFEDQAELEVRCWRTLTAKDSQRLIPNNVIGNRILGCLLKLENMFSKQAANWGAYPVIVLKKRTQPMETTRATLTVDKPVPARL